ncbi:MAG: GPP34 family phosphoprotein [Candidatus Omnitrophica bacterium]|nr:GPP34 family phosphoprotein [Candidatus Omnitrophota bacterium]
MLSLPEEMILIALNHEKGALYTTANWTLGAGLAGAMLTELALRNRLAISDNVLRALDSSATGDPALDDVLNQIESREKPIKVSFWIQKLSMQGKKHGRLYLERLVESKILKEEERLVLFFSSKRYFLRNKKLKRELFNRIRWVVLRRHEPDARLLCLLRLIQTCDWVRFIVEKDKVKEAKQRIKEWIEKNAAVEGAEQAQAAAAILSSLTSVKVT